MSRRFRDSFLIVFVRRLNCNWQQITFFRGALSLGSRSLSFYVFCGIICGTSFFISSNHKQKIFGVETRNHCCRRSKMYFFCHYSQILPWRITWYWKRLLDFWCYLVNCKLNAFKKAIAKPSQHKAITGTIKILFAFYFSHLNQLLFWISCFITFMLYVLIIFFFLDFH